MSAQDAPVQIETVADLITWLQTQPPTARVVAYASNYYAELGEAQVTAAPIVLLRGGISEASDFPSEAARAVPAVIITGR
ncbi:MAG: hypothetical protein NUW22_05155 [Acidobacteria bacterium]|nr:hypothetical protein [Acidobacteriota bacterium]